MEAARAEAKAAEVARAKAEVVAQAARAKVEAAAQAARAEAEAGRGEGGGEGS